MNPNRVLACKSLKQKGIFTLVTVVIGPWREPAGARLSQLHTASRSRRVSA